MTAALLLFAGVAGMATVGWALRFLIRVVDREAHGWLEHAPRVVLARTIRRLPPDQQAIWAEEWDAELVMRQGRPLSALVFALRTARGGSAFARELSIPIMAKPQPEGDTDAPSADDSQVLIGQVVKAATANGWSVVHRKRSRAVQLVLIEKRLAETREQLRDLFDS